MAKTKITKEDIVEVRYFYRVVGYGNTLCYATPAELQAEELREIKKEHEKGTWIQLYQVNRYVGVNEFTLLGEFTL